MFDVCMQVLPRTRKILHAHIKDKAFVCSDYSCVSVFKTQPLALTTHSDGSIVRHADSANNKAKLLTRQDLHTHIKYQSFVRSDVSCVSVFKTQPLALTTLSDDDIAHHATPAKADTKSHKRRNLHTHIKYQLSVHSHVSCDAV